MMKNYLVTVQIRGTYKVRARVVTAHNEAEAKAIIMITKPDEEYVMNIKEFTPEAAREEYERQCETGIRYRGLFDKTLDEMGEW